MDKWYIQLVPFGGQLLGRVQRNTSINTGNVVLGVFTLAHAEDIALGLNHGGNAADAGVKIKKSVKL